MKLIDSQEAKYGTELGKAKAFFDKYVSCCDLQDNQIVYGSLAGSHSKGLNNSRSDFDIMVYYRLSLHNLLRLHRHTIATHPDDEMKTIPAEATLYDFRGNKFESILTPIRALGGADKDLWHGLARQNIDILFKFLRSYTLMTTPGIDGVRKFLLDEFRLEPEAIYGYFDGYATSQLMAHRKQSSGERKTGTQLGVDEVVKTIIEGVNMILSGALLLETQEMSFSFEPTFRKYAGNFSNPDFVLSLYRHKSDRERIEEPAASFVKRADAQRDRLYEECKATIRKAREATPLRKLTDADKRFNTMRLDELFLDLYGIS